MGLRTWTNVNGTVNGTATYYRTGFEWMVENSDEDRIANNRSLVTIRLWISSTSGVGYAWNLGNNTSWKEHDGGNRANMTTQFDLRNISGTGRHYCGYHTSVFPVGSYFSFYVYHNSDGTRSLPVSTYLYGGVSSFQNGSTSTTLTLPAIPRYAAITGFTLNKASGGAGLSRLVASWSTDTTCDYVAYSLNGGAWTNSGTSGTSGTFNLNELTPATTYTLSLAVKRTDSQLYTYSSSAKSQTTYDIARITAAPNNNVDVDPPFTISYTNPSGASLQTGIYKTDASTVIASYRNCSGTAYEYLFTAGERTAFYNQTPTTNTLPLRIYLKTSDGLGNTYLHYAERTFEVVNANPTFTTYTIADTNPTTLALTDSDTKIVSGYSSLAATVSVANKAVGVKGASVTQYKLTVGGVIVDTESWSENTDVVLTKTPATSATTTVTAVDSRGNDTSVSVNGTLIEYTGIAVGSSSASRQSALAEEVDLVVSGTFWDESFGTVTNSISATYEYRVVGAGSWTAGTTDITPTVVDGAFTISETILGDTALGFDNTKQYEIKVTIADELDTAISTLTIPTSKPWIVLDDAGVGIRTIYDDTIGGALQIGGDTNIDGYTTITGNTDITGALQVNGNIKTTGQLESSGNTNQGSWNGPTVGTVTQVVDNTSAQHSVIVGKRLDNGARLYGIDLYDNYSAPIMKLFAGNNELEIGPDIKKNGTILLKKTDVVNNMTTNDGTLPLGANQGKWLFDMLKARSQQPIGEYVLFQSDGKTIVGNNTWHYLGTVYSLKSNLLEQYPLKTGYTRKYKLKLTKTDNKTTGVIYVRLQTPGGTNQTEYLFPITWGSVGIGVRANVILPITWETGVPPAHCDIHLTPDFATNGTVVVYQVSILIYDELV
jgi:hypothetical protein